jgi:hypothetical protein
MTTRRWMIAAAVVGLDSAYIVRAIRNSDDDYQIPITEAGFVHVVLACAAIVFFSSRFAADRYAARRPWLPMSPDPPPK